MRGEGSSSEADLDTSRHALVFALCHEIGNLLAASRLEAALLTDVSGADPNQQVVTVYIPKPSVIRLCAAALLSIGMSRRWRRHLS